MVGSCLSSVFPPFFLSFGGPHTIGEAGVKIRGRGSSEATWVSLSNIAVCTGTLPQSFIHQGRAPQHTLDICQGPEASEWTQMLWVDWQRGVLIIGYSVTETSPRDLLRMWAGYLHLAPALGASMWAISSIKDLDNKDQKTVLPTGVSSFCIHCFIICMAFNIRRAFCQYTFSSELGNWSPDAMYYW